MEGQKPWYETLLGGVGETFGEAVYLAREAEMNKLRRKAGVIADDPRPRSEDQNKPVVSPGGANRDVVKSDGFTDMQMKKFLMYGGGALALVAVLVLVLGSRK